MVEDAESKKPIQRFHVGSRVDLEQRLKGSNPVFTLVRAINDTELEQLLKEGAEEFELTEGVQFERSLGAMVQIHGEHSGKSGTVIVYQIPEQVYRERRFQESVTGYPECKVNFKDKVDVYSLTGQT